MILPEEELRALLVSSGKVTESSLQEVLAYAADSHVSLEKALSDKDVLPDIEFGQLVAAHVQLPFVDLLSIDVPDQILNSIPETTAKRSNTIAFERTDTELKVASSELPNQELLQLLAAKTGLTVLPHYATQKALDSILSHYRTNFQDVFERFLIEDSHIIATEAHDPPVKKMVDVLIQTALHEHASDIHIEPQENEMIVRFRIDGVLQDIVTLPKKIHSRIITRIKVLAGLRTDQHLAAQDGKIKTEVDGDRLDLRVSILPIVDGEKVVMRLLSSHTQQYSLSDLGIDEKQLDKVRQAVKNPWGMILVTGPTGSGKTTTIYAMLKTVNTRESNLTSIEDPVEYRIKGANQVQVNEKTDLTFANGLRSLLRQDPNYIFVGEIRDNETAAIAVNAALTGHLVFSTLHTNDAAGSIPRLSDMKVEPFLVASTVKLIIAQRLVRRICPHCRISETITVDELSKFLSLETIEQHYIPVGEKKEVRIYKGKGCRACHNSGYLGRIGVYEILEITKSIQDLIAKKADAAVIAKQAAADGMASMFDDGVTKITKGMTTIEEVLRVTTTEAATTTPAEEEAKPKK